MIFRSFSICFASLLMCIPVQTVCALDEPPTGKTGNLKDCRYYIATGPTDEYEFGFTLRYANATSSLLCSKETQGSIENIQLLLNDSSVLAGIVQGDILQEVLAKQKTIISPIAPIDVSRAHLIVRAESKYNNFHDLANRIICVGRDGSGTRYTALRLMAQKGLNWIEASGGLSGCLGQLDRGSINGVFVMTPNLPPSIASQVRVNYRLLSLPALDGYDAATIDIPMTTATPEKSSKVVSSMDRVTTFSTPSYLIHNMGINGTSAQNLLSDFSATVVASLDIKIKDRLCAHSNVLYGIPYSIYKKKSCSIGYYSKDW